ncbi:MAG: hypothetical protein VCC01_00030, partial [Candidatus Hydrogenedentota bacterium]
MPPRRKPKPRPRSRSHVAKRRIKRSNLMTKDGSVLYIKFKNTQPRMDSEGKEYKRFFKLETLTNALEKQIRTNDKFVLSSIRQVLGSMTIRNIDAEMVQESKYRFTFRLKLQSENRKQATFGLVVAKNNQECSEIVKREHSLMRILHERVPKCVVEPLKGGTIFLPDRHRRAEQDRDIYAYMTMWTGGFHELDIQSSGNLALKSPRLTRMTPGQTQAAKRRMIEIIVRTYDPNRRNAMSIPLVPVGDFIAAKQTKGTPQLKISACTDMQNRVSPAKLIHRIVDADWKIKKQVYCLMPGDPAEFVQALTNALGKEDAMDWISQYRKAVKSKRLPELPRLDLYTLDQLN